MTKKDEKVLGPGAYGDPENADQTREEFVGAEKKAQSDARREARDAEKATQGEAQ